jgi:hypothetical protein
MLSDFGRLNLNLWQIDLIRFGGNVSAALDYLRSELRYQCSFEEIADLLRQHGPLDMVTFSGIMRSDAVHTRFGGKGEQVGTWYAPEPQQTYPGWLATLRWTAKGGLSHDLWEARAWLQEIGMIYSDPGAKIDCQMLGGKRIAMQSTALYSTDFPAMWLADRLRGTWA